MISDFRFFLKMEALQIWFDLSDWISKANLNKLWSKKILPWRRSFINRNFLALLLDPGYQRIILHFYETCPVGIFHAKKVFLQLWLIDSVGWLWQEVYIGQTDPNEPNSGAPPLPGHSGPRKQLKFSTRYFTKLCFSREVFKTDRATIQNLCKYLVFFSQLCGYVNVGFYWM